MRPAVDSTRLRAFLRGLSRAASEPTRLYLTGGGSQLLRGLRDATLDIDLTFEPESDELLRSMVSLKQVQAELFRYPAVDPNSLLTAVDRLAGVENA